MKLKNSIFIIVILWATSLWAIGPKPGVHFESWTDGPRPDINENGGIESRHATKASGFSVQTPPKGLVILVSFSDTLFRTDKAEIDSMLNGQNYSRRYIISSSSGQRQLITSKGSARKYFSDQSNGAYQPQFDVVGPVQLTKSCTYYGQNSSGQSGNDKYAYKMIQEACKAVDSQVNFKDYDSDNDGYVDYVYVIYAGYSESDGAGSDLIWPHTYHATYYSSLQLDGKIIDLYACCNERDDDTDQHEGIGTFCHEFSHILGLPDFYATNSATHKTMGMWDIMDAGPYNNDGNTPPNYSGYERMMMGWQTPRLITDSQNVTLSALSLGGEVLLVSATGKHNLSGTNPNPSTFYLLENRQQHSWDAHILGHGLMLTKVQFNATSWTRGTVNNSASSMGVDLVEADGIAQSSDDDPYSYYGKRGDLFPAGSDHYDSIAPFNTYTLTEIEESYRVIQFKFRGGVREDTALPEIQSQETMATQKMYHNGQIYIIRNDQVYDLLGNQL